jgi:hypothetical protein
LAQESESEPCLFEGGVRRYVAGRLVGSALDTYVMGVYCMGMSDVKKSYDEGRRAVVRGTMAGVDGSVALRLVAEAIESSLKAASSRGES